jgi:2-iminobutanoate/2-iminopropanoate deaminase
MFKGGKVDKEVIATTDAPEAIGPYAQAIASGDFIFCSGQIHLDPTSGELVQGSIADQTRRCMQSLAGVLRAAGSDLDKLVKVTVYLADMNDYAEFNEAYAEFAGDPPPARAAIAVAGLPRGARVEIECIAHR